MEVICDEHTDITSISDDPRVLHNTLNNTLKNKDQKNKLITKKYNKLLQSYSELTSKYNELLQEKQEGQMEMDITTNEEHAATKTENLLLRELNNELKSKNSLLEELLNKEKEVPNLNNKTYAQAITTKQIIPQPKKIQKIVIKRKNIEDKTDIKGKVLYYLTKE